MSENTVWRCGVCGYSHTGATPPTSCPVCRVSAEKFNVSEKVNESVFSSNCAVCGKKMGFFKKLFEKKDCEICGADRFLHYNFSGNETWQRYRPLRNIIFKNIHAVNIAMPISLYGTESNQVELTMENIFIHMREGSTTEELIRACHYSRISLDHIQIDGFRGACLVRSKGVGTVDFRNVDCSLPKEMYVVQTDEDFVINKI